MNARVVGEYGQDVAQIVGDPLARLGEAKRSADGSRVILGPIDRLELLAERLGREWILAELIEGKNQGRDDFGGDL